MATEATNYGSGMRWLVAAPSLRRGSGSPPPVPSGAPVPPRAVGAQLEAVQAIDKMIVINGQVNMMLVKVAAATSVGPRAQVLSPVPRLSGAARPQCTPKYPMPSVPATFMLTP